jgi:hypothetical protein
MGGGSISIGRSIEQQKLQHCGLTAAVRETTSLAVQNIGKRSRRDDGVRPSERMGRLTSRTLYLPHLRAIIVSICT